MWIILLHVDSLFVPRFDLVPLLVAVGPGDVIRTCPAAPPVSSVPEPHATAGPFLRWSSSITTPDTDDPRWFDPRGGDGHGHSLLVRAAIVVELQSFADFRHQRVHFFRIHGDGLFQKDVILLPARHDGGFFCGFVSRWFCCCWYE